MVDGEKYNKSGPGEAGEDIGQKKGPRREDMQEGPQQKDSGPEGTDGEQKDSGPQDGPEEARGTEPDDGQGEWRVSGLDAAPEYKLSGREGQGNSGEGPQGTEGTQGGDYPGRKEIHGYKGGSGQEGPGAERRQGGEGGPEGGRGSGDGGGRGGFQRRDSGIHGGGNFGRGDGQGREQASSGGRDGGGGGYGGRDRGRGGGYGGRDRGRGGGYGGRDRGGGGGYGGNDGGRDGDRRGGGYGGRGGGGSWGGRDGPRREGEGMPGRSEGAGGGPAPPEHVDREIVLPGDLLDSGRLKAGPGAYTDGESVFSACLGIKTVRGDSVGVIPISGKYMPRVGDIVVGKVMEMTPGAWIIDLNSPYVAPLPGSETPWTVEFGETSKYMSLGDTVIVQIKDVNQIGRVGVSMLGPDLRKVVGGQTMDVDATKVPRLIGRGGSMIGLLKRLTRCRIMVGQNGRVWLDGTVEDVTVAMGAIRMIEHNAHRLGLTDAVANFIQGMRNRLEAQRVAREKAGERAEERAIINDRVQRLDVSKEVQEMDGLKDEEE